ncbi:putative E3 ubiquitin-protein ligase XBAT31 [Acorus gramineus]|uniref:RING-type E3 ubiquitin transferase n=1 Tax=Acorus gramineus TaxID=55184 RepID=A0AAV9AMW6_ACOGR|nr:putative E3 ubiquitin-protein ligase XBAT31 [Acorus gramineus]
MGQGLSCNPTHDHHFFRAVQTGDLESVECILRSEPSIIHHTTAYERLSALHIAAANGRVEVLCLVLDRLVKPDLLNRNKQTPLMLAAMHGKISCVQKLIEAGANILMFDSLHGRSCLHYAAYYGHSDCLQAILAAAHSTPVADSWGFARFVNVRDGNGATPLHLAARQRRPDCVHFLLDSGALVCASTGGYGSPGSTPLHLAARGGCLDCVRELLAWGANRLQRDLSGRIPYNVALKRNHRACAALLNPTSAEPLVWPSPIKFISELNSDAKILLERALMEANRTRENNILKETTCLSPSPSHSDEATNDDVPENETDLCCICFDQVCTLEVQDCGHQMCAHCTLALCCHSKPNPVTSCMPSPVCPFCRSNIARLVVAKSRDEEKDKENQSKSKRGPRRSRNLSEGSSSFKGLSSAMGSFGKRGSGRVADEPIDKP